VKHSSTRFLATLVGVGMMLACRTAFAASPFVEVPMNGSQVAETATGAGLPSYFGSAAEHFTVFRLGPFAPGRRYELTLTFDAGTDIGYATSWVDGDPWGKDHASFVGIGTGTGTRELKGKKEKFLFTVDAKSTSDTLYVVVRSSTAWKVGVAVTDRLTGVNRDSQDAWGYYYVNDFDFNRTAPFLLTRGGGAAAPVAQSPASGYVDVAPGQVKKSATTSDWAWMPTFLGGPDQLYTVFRLGPLDAGKRYEATLTFDAGTDIGYAMSWIDGDPKGKDFLSFVGIGTGTGTREMKGAESKFLFTVDAKSTAAFLYLVVRSNKPWDLSLALADRLSGVTRDSQDKWGYYYVTDFDVNRISPFLLTRGTSR
jgi:hypothetical protein